jgi:hypothetical protein
MSLIALWTFLFVAAVFRKHLPYDFAGVDGSCSDPIQENESQEIVRDPHIPDSYK